MRIAFVTFEYPPFIIGGAGIYAKNVTENLAKMGHEVFVFTFPVKDLRNNNLENLKIIEVAKSKKLSLFPSLNFCLGLPKAIEIMEKNHGTFDIIHFNGYSYWFFKKKFSKAPKIVTIHHLATEFMEKSNLLSKIQIKKETSFFHAIIERNCIKNVDKIVAVSNFTRNQIVKKYNIPSDEIQVIYNGMDFGDYKSIDKKELKDLRLKWNINPKNPVILFVGRVDDRRKGLDILLKVFKMVLHHLDATLLIVGQGNQLIPKKLAKSLNVLANVIFTGFVDEKTLKKCYLLCDVYVCPSRLEGFGLTLLDAMAAKKPIVATNNGAIPEVLANYEMKNIVEGNNIETFSKILINVLKNLDQTLNKDEFLKTEFTWFKSVSSLNKIYEEIIH